MTGSTDKRPAAPSSEITTKDGGSNLPKRFYKTAGVATHNAAYVILLDDRTLKTPQKNTLGVPSRALAKAIADEWNAQTEVVNPMTMPLTRLANSVLDGVVENQQVIVDDLVKYSGHDLLCYRAESPETLVARQTAQWDPVLDWAEHHLGVRWLCAAGVMPVEQPAATATAVRHAVSGLNAFQLAALHELTALTGSALLALAYRHGELTVDAVWQSAHIDEDFQIEQWGEDAEAGQRRLTRRREAEAADRLFRLAGQE